MEKSRILITSRHAPQFLNEHCGTHRTAAGLLSETAGKYLPLDTLAATFFSSPLAKRPDIIAQAKSFLADLAASDAAVKANESVHYYIKAMEKIVDKGDGWLVKETARFAKLVNSPSLAPSKIDEIIIKKNILSSFVYRKLEDAASQVSEAASDATDAVKNAAGDAAQKVEQIRQEL
jgi:protein disulfide-isomerase A6